jgi:hypothetical protein
MHSVDFLNTTGAQRYTGMRMPPPGRLVIDSENPITAGIIAAWPNCMPHGGDAAGNHPLTEVQSSAIKAAGGELGQTPYFTSATTEYFLSTSNTPDFDSTTGSLSCWIKMDAAPSSRAGGPGRSSSGTSPNGVALMVETTGALSGCFAKDISNQIALTGSTLAAGVWMHVVLVWRPAGSQCAIYCDGRLIATGTSPTGFGFPAGIDPRVVNTAGVTLHSSGVGLTGSVANEIWWNRALSDEEVGYLFAVPWCCYRPAAPTVGAVGVTSIVSADYVNQVTWSDSFGLEPILFDLIVWSGDNTFVLPELTENESDVLYWHDQFVPDSGELGNLIYRR